MSDLRNKMEFWIFVKISISYKIFWVKYPMVQKCFHFEIDYWILIKLYRVIEDTYFVELKISNIFTLLKRLLSGTGFEIFHKQLYVNRYEIFYIIYTNFWKFFFFFCSFALDHTFIAKCNFIIPWVICSSKLFSNPDLLK